MTLTLTTRALKIAAQFADILVLDGLSREVAAERSRQMAEALVGKKPSPPKVAQGAVNAITAVYVDLYRTKFGEAPILDGKHYGMLSKLLRDYSQEIVTQRLLLLAATQDPFLRGAGFTISALYTHWPKLVVAARAHRQQQAADAPSDCQHSPRCQTAIEHRQRFLDGAKSSSSSGATSPSRITLTPKGPSSGPP